MGCGQSSNKESNLHEGGYDSEADYDSRKALEAGLDDRRSSSQPTGSTATSSDNSDKQPRNGQREKLGANLDNNFRPMKILVYRNGDLYDPGTIVSITRRQFRTWVSLLDFLTRRIKLKEGAVHHLYCIDSGEECRHFKYIRDRGRYVATYGQLRKVQYGQQPNPKWVVEKSVSHRDPGALTSGESVCKYLEKNKFRPTLDDMWEDSSFDLKGKNKQR